ncbi:MAG: zinc ABC transporter solute-binding protein [Tissierellia bacterium]|nr:zinc ABC transporter solute-binding protein [Tissierellia bacterium]
MVKKLSIMIITILMLSILLIGCDSNRQSTQEIDNDKLNIVATTTIIGDTVRKIGGDKINLQVLMGPGIDPHLYKASAGDVNKMQKADLLIYNGLHLEGKMGDIFEQLQKTNKNTYAVADVIDPNNLIESEEFAGSYDPHIWFDVQLWMEVVEGIKDTLINIDPGNKDYYSENTLRYLKELEDLNNYIKSRTDELPEAKRVLITAHDAFSYFGKAYGFQVKGLQGLSTATEAGTADVRDLADFIATREIPAIFIESSVPSKNMEALKKAVESRNFSVEIGGELFSDSLGTPGTEEGTYIGTVKHNINTIVDGLLQ